MLSDSDVAAIRSRAASALEGSHEDTIGTDEEYLDGLARDLAADVLALLHERNPGHGGVDLTSL